MKTHFAVGDYVQLGNHIRLIRGVNALGWYILNTGPDTEAQNLKPCPWLPRNAEVAGAVMGVDAMARFGKAWLELLGC